MYWKTIYRSFFVRLCQSCAVCSSPAPVFCRVHRNSGFVSDMAMSKEFVREERNKYSGKTGGHCVTCCSQVYLHQLVTLFSSKFEQRVSNSVNTQCPWRSRFTHWVFWASPTQESFQQPTVHLVTDTEV